MYVQPGRACLLNPAFVKCSLWANCNFPSQGDSGVPGAPGLPVSSQCFITSHYSVGTWMSTGKLKTRPETAGLSKYSCSYSVLTPCPVTLSHAQSWCLISIPWIGLTSRLAACLDGDKGRTAVRRRHMELQVLWWKGHRSTGCCEAGF